MCSIRYPETQIACAPLLWYTIATCSIMHLDLPPFLQFEFAIIEISAKLKAINYSRFYTFLLLLLFFF